MTMTQQTTAGAPDHSPAGPQQAAITAMPPFEPKVTTAPGAASGRESDKEALDAAIQQLDTEDGRAEIEAAAHLAALATTHPALLAPATPRLLAALDRWREIEAHRDVIRALEAIADWSLKPLRSEIETLRNTLWDQRSAATRAFAAQTLARLSASDASLLETIWDDLAQAIQHDANSHQVDGMLQAIHLLAGSPGGRILQTQIRQLVEPFTDHWRPQVATLARTIISDLERNAVLPGYLHYLKEQLAIFRAPPALPAQVETVEQAPYVALRDLCQLPQAEQIKAYRPFLPNSLLTHYEIDEQTLRDRHGDFALCLASHADTAMVELTLWRQRSDQDPALLLHFGETSNGQIQIYLVVVNNLDAERFDVDYDGDGRPTLLGLVGRNLAEEARAMRAGLAPGQVRPGLGLLSRRLLPRVEQTLAGWGKQYLFAQPLAYHNAILLERWGFFYLTGQRFMTELDERLRSGDLRARLDGSTFRPLNAWQTARGRSWAIHDGILGEPWPELHMARRIGHPSQVNTFQNAIF